MLSLKGNSFPISLGALNATLSSNKFGDVFKFNDYAFNSTIGLQITVPIFNGFMRANQITEAKLNIEKTNIINSNT